MEASEKLTAQEDSTVRAIGGLVLPSIALGALFWLKRRDWF